MKEYYYIDSSKNRIGPMAFEDLIKVGLYPNTPIWSEGMSDWTPAGNVDELKFLFAQNFAQQPPQNDGYPVGEKPNNWLIWSILSTLFCCLPFGIAAIVYASQVDGYWNGGRYEEAYKAVKKAKQFTLIGVISGFIISFIYGILIFFGMLTSGVFHELM